MESKENGTPTASKQVPTGAGVGVGGGGGGLFDDEDEDDDFFSGKSLKKSDSGKFVRMGSLHYNPRSGGILSPQTSGFFPLLFQLHRRSPNPRKLLTFSMKMTRMATFSVRSTARQLRARRR